MSSEQGPRTEGMGASAIDAGGRQMDSSNTAEREEAES